MRSPRLKDARFRQLARLVGTLLPLLLVLALIQPGRPAAAGVASTLKLNPPSQTVPVGAIFTVTIDVETCKGCELCITACPPRVLVMSKSPGTFIADIPVPFEHPRDPELRSTPEFAKLTGEVSRSLREAAR